MRQCLALPDPTHAALSAYVGSMQRPHASARRMVVFGADLRASDGNPMTPERELLRVMGVAEGPKAGDITLFHDNKSAAATMLPAFLKELKDQGYHAVPVRAPAARCTKCRHRYPSQRIIKPHQPISSFRSPWWYYSDAAVMMPPLS